VCEGRRVGRFYSVTLTDEMPCDALRGHYIVQGNTFVWQDGPAIRAMREGAVLIINEVDLAGPDVEAFLHELLDNRASCNITLPNGEVVTPAAGFKVIATMNGVPGDLRDALASRFPVTVEINEVHPNAVKSLSADLQNAALGTVTHDDPELRINMRSWIEFDRLRTLVDEQVAAQATFGIKRSREILDGLRIARAK